MITHHRINSYFNEVTSLPCGNVFSERGFAALADWSEQQQWWHSFAMEHDLSDGWRSTGMGDCYLFAVNLFKFLNDTSRFGGRSQGPQACPHWQE